jgi:hypothetical protein
MLVARPASNDGRHRRRESEVMLIDGPWRGDPTTTSPRFPNKVGVSMESKESTAMNEPVRFSTAFCMSLLAGGPLL